MPVKIITNNQPRNLLDWNELTEKEQADYDIDPSKADECSFVRYKGNCYWLDGEFMVLSSVVSDPFHKWDGVLQDTFFSGILVKWTSDGEQVIMGRYYA
jgi:hypothetical protein